MELHPAERIRLVREHLTLSQKQFGQEIGIPLTTVSKYERGEVKPSFDILSNIGKRFSVNLNWLLAGKGEMFLQSNVEKPDIDLSLKPTITRDIAELELVGVTFAGEIAAGEPSPNLYSINSGHIDLPKVLVNGNPHNYVTMVVNGRSMQPAIMHGDVVLIRQRIEWETSVGQVVAVRVDSDLTLKHLVFSKQINRYILMPYNDQYTPIIVSAELGNDTRLIGTLASLIRRFE